MCPNLDLHVDNRDDKNYSSGAADNPFYFHRKTHGVSPLFPVCYITYEHIKRIYAYYYFFNIYL